MADEMIVFAGDPSPEVRASAERALAAAPLPLAIPALLEAVRDSNCMIFALELGGGSDKVTAELSEPQRHGQTAARLLEALRDGAAGLWGTRPAYPVVESIFP